MEVQCCQGPQLLGPAQVRDEPAAEAQDREVRAVRGVQRRGAMVLALCPSNLLGGQWCRPLEARSRAAGVFMKQTEM